MLYIVATPIGNLEDITLRALRVLREVQVIACEDTRHTRKLLSHYDIHTPMVSYHEHNEGERAAMLVARMQNGESVALVSDAGTPLVSDPGFRLVQEAIAQGITVVPLPGAAAFLTALAAAGLPTKDFLFAGFLPSKPAARRARLQQLAALPTTIICYEAPHRLRQSLAEALAVLGDRPCVVARELTKRHEEFVRGSLAEVKAAFDDQTINPTAASTAEQIIKPTNDNPAAQNRANLANPAAHKIIKGEFVLLFGAPSAATQSLAAAEPALSISAAVAELMRVEGLDEKSALKRLARQRGISKSEAYRLLVADKANR